MASDESSGQAEGGAGSPATVLGLVGQLATASEQATLVHAALRSGLLVRCAEPTTVQDLAAAIGAPQDRLDDFCTALVALGALEKGPEGTVRLAPDWAALARDGVDVMLERTLAGAVARRGVLDDVLDDAASSYWELDGDSRRALADSVTLPTTTGIGRALSHSVVVELPELEQALKSGARWLELGCGVAGQLLGVLAEYPEVSAVGVDLAPDLLDVARSRALEIGVADRVEFVVGDASTYHHDEPFDIVFWSQFFFPAATRRAALENAFARLRPGGLLLCPVLPGLDEDPASRSFTAQQTSLSTLLLRGWAPVRSSAELTAEVAAAGFADPQEHRGALAHSVTARRP